MKFLCDAERCIECNGCVTACKNENDIPWGVNRRRVVTINDGDLGERSISVACMHCSDAPCATVCPVDCFYTTNDGVVLHDKDICIGCGYCFYAEGKLPLCAEMCATKALLAGDGDRVSDIFRERVMYRGAGALQWGWGVAYDKQGIKG
jgi:formate dehydrogenase iron-sulfur subunit